MKIWVIWPTKPPAMLTTLFEEIGATMVRVDDVLDQAEQGFGQVEADVVLLNSTTQGTKPWVSWVAHSMSHLPDVRWVVAMPSPLTEPGMDTALVQLLALHIYDWVFDDEGMADQLKERLQTPWNFIQASKMLGGPDVVMRRLTPGLEETPPEVAYQPPVDTPTPSTKKAGRWLADRLPKREDKPKRPPRDKPIKPPRERRVKSVPAPADEAAPVRESEAVSMPAPPPPPVVQTIMRASTLRPVIIAVYGISVGVGVSCTVVGLAERLTALGQQPVIAELPNSATLAYRQWHRPIQADLANPDDRYNRLNLQRRWTHIVVDCHNMRANVPREADLVVEVGPGAPHQRYRWTDHDTRINTSRQQVTFDNVVVVLSPHPAVGLTIQTVKKLTAWPIVVAPDVFSDDPATQWDPVLASVWPPGLAAPQRSPHKHRLKELLISRR